MKSKFAIIIFYIVYLSVFNSVSFAKSQSFSYIGYGEKVYLPSTYTQKKKWPIILLLHSYAGSQQIIDTYFGFSDEVSKRGFILVTAEGLRDSYGYGYWNATDGCCDFDHRNNDDAGYLKKLISDLQIRYSVDPKRIYDAGHSNGGFMAHRLACDLRGTIAAIASFAGETWKAAEKCAPPLPVSVLQIQASDDDTIFYGGDEKGYPRLAPYPGATETIERWRALNRCQPVSRTRRINLAMSIPGIDTTARAWNNCANGSSVELWTIDAHRGFLHFPHTPLLREEFTDRVLSFLLQKHRE